MSNMVCCATCKHLYEDTSKELCSRCRANRRVNWEKNEHSAMYGTAIFIRERELVGRQ